MNTKKTIDDFKNKIIQGDCIEVLQEIPDNSIDMILCDLPYGTTACKWDTIIPFDLLWIQYKRIIKENGAIVLTASQPFTSKLIMSNINMFKHSWVWEKQKGANFMSAKYQPIKYHEDIIVFCKTTVLYIPQKYKVLEFSEILKYSKEKLKQLFDNKEYSNYGKIDRRKNVNNVNNPKDSHYGSMNIKIRNSDDGTRYPKSIIKINKSINKNIHPTQKPVALFEYLIKTYTNEGMLVLDNCIGSGTTAVACKQTRRNYIGIELDKDYCDIARKRVAAVPKRLINWFSK